jgi:hypothetical protein
VEVGLRGHDLPQEGTELRVIVDNQDGHCHGWYPPSSICIPLCQEDSAHTPA